MMTRKATLIAMGAILAMAATPAWAAYIQTSYEGERISEELWTWGHEDDSRVTGDPLNSTVAWLAQTGPGAWDLHLTNDSPVATSEPADILQGVFFTLDETIHMAPRDQVGIPNGSGFLADEGDEDTLQGWAYRNDLATGDSNPFNDVYGATHGIANPGLDTFGPNDTFASWLGQDDNQWPNHSPAGSYGIVSGETEAPPGPGSGYVNNSLAFRFNAPGLDPDEHFDDVVFHYGTSVDVVPEPATMTLLGLGLAGFGARRFVSRKKKA